MDFLLRVPTVAARRLCLLTLFYLALPLLIFLLGWVRPLVGIPCALLLMGTLGALAQRGWRPFPGEEEPTRTQWRELGVGLLWTWIPVALFVLQIGAGGFGLGTSDWTNKHNLIFADLVRYPWPVVYRGEGATSNGLMLVYYVGYYLPAAAVGKVLGWSAANIAWQLWTQFGFLLVCSWMVAFVGPRVRWLGALFLVFSGAGLLGLLLNNIDAKLHLSPATSKYTWNLDIVKRNRWNNTASYYVVYGSHILHLAWAPHHLLPSWLGISLLLNRWSSGRKASAAKAAANDAPLQSPRWDGAAGGSALLGWSLLVLWSPLAALGCLPFLLALLGRELRAALSNRQTSKRPSTWPLSMALVVSSLLCAGLIALYLAVRIPPPPGALPQRGDHLKFLLPSLWNDEGWHALWRYGVFVLAEFGLLYMLIWPRRGDTAERAWRTPLLVGLVVLMILPCFLYGYYNDLSMRVSIPALAVLLLATALFFQNTNVSRVRRVGALVLLLCGSVVFLDYTRSAGRILYHREWDTRRPISVFNTLVEEYRNDPRYLLGQYTGPTNSPFARFLAK